MPPADPRDAPDVGLASSEERMRLAMEASGIGMWDLDPVSGVLVWDERCRELFGQPPDVGQGYERFLAGVHPDDRGQTDDAILRALDPQSGGRYRAEYRTIGVHDGVERYIASEGRAFFDEHGRATRFLGTALDITARRRAEEQASEEARINETLYRVGSLISANLDLDAIVQRVTDEATVLCRARFGAFFYNVTSERGETFMLYSLSGAPKEAFANFRLPRATPIFKPTFDGSAIVRIDDVTKDPRFGAWGPQPKGHLPVVSYLAIPVIAPSGEVIGGLFFAHDEPGVFTARDERMLAAVAAQAAVAFENSRLYQLAERSAKRTAMLQALTAAFSEARTPAEVTDVAVTKGCEALGARAGVLLLLAERDAALRVARSTGFPDAISSQWQTVPLKWRTPSTDALRTGEALFFDSLEVLQAQYPDVGPRLFPGDKAFAAIPLIAGRRAFGVLSLSFSEPRTFHGADRELIMAAARQCAQALDRARLYEAEAMARADAEAASRAKDEFLATISHELRTPLNAILGWARMLRSSALTEERRARALETVERNAQAQARLIEDLLDVARIMTGKLRLDVQPVDLAAVIEAAIEAVRPAADARSVRIVSVLDSSAPIAGDASRLQQVVWNLLSNAVKFTPKGGRVQVRLERVESSVEIVVADSGQGIPPEFLAHLFERFRQADGSTTRAHGGLGLGLSIVKHLAELHGGTVRGLSEGEGKGATFVVRLPLAVLQGDARALRDSHPRVSTPVPGLNLDCPLEIDGLRIVAVDDEEDARELLVEVLSHCGATVTPVSTALEALEAVQRLRPDVLLSDIGMPGLDGYELIRQLRALPPEKGGKTPAIALTAYARTEDRTKVLRAGFTTHLAKPIDPSELLVVIAHVVRIAGS